MQQDAQLKRDVQYLIRALRIARDHGVNESDPDFLRELLEAVLEQAAKVN